MLRYCIRRSPDYALRLDLGFSQVKDVARLIAIATVAILATTAAGTAQTRSSRDATTVYGARLNAKGQPVGLNQARVNGRINSRLDNRLSLRIEHYRSDDTNNPTAAFRAKQDDKSRSAPITAPTFSQDGSF